jgi:hypothetical protein
MNSSLPAQKNDGCPLPNDQETSWRFQGLLTWKQRTKSGCVLYVAHSLDSGTVWNFVYLTRCVHQLVLESQLTHKTVNLIFQLVIVNNKLTILRGSWLSTTNRWKIMNTFCVKIDKFILRDNILCKSRKMCDLNGFKICFQNYYILADTFCVKVKNTFCEMNVGANLAGGLGTVNCHLCGGLGVRKKMILFANTWHLWTWFQSKSLHIYFNVTNKNRSCVVTFLELSS